MEKQIRYEIALEIPNMEEYLLNDVHYFSIFRFPIIKTASFAILRISMSYVLAIQAHNSLSDNEFPEVGIRILFIDEINPKTPVSPVFNRKYVILNVNNLTPLHPNLSSVTMDLLLCDPIIHKMETTLTYNKLLNNMTGMEMILDYEDYLKNTYGNYFIFNKYISEKNKYIHEQILTKPFNTSVSHREHIQNTMYSDLDVPQYLINQYKPTHPFSFYFFDEFSSINENILTNHMITLWDPEVIKPFNVQEESDILVNTSLSNIIPISDVFQSIDKSEEVRTYTTSDMIYSVKKIANSEINQGSTEMVKKINLPNDRGIYSNEQTFSKSKAGQSTNFLNVYTPDNITTAEKRITMIQESFLKRFDHLVYYTTKDCLYDWLQFGQKYNMDAHFVETFDWTPLCITNIFHRETIKKPFCSHSVKYAMLKFKHKDLF